MHRPGTRIGQQHFHIEVSTEDGHYNPFDIPGFSMAAPLYTIIFDDAEQAFDTWADVIHNHVARFLGDPADLHDEERAEGREYWLEETSYQDPDEMTGISVDGGGGMEYALFECFGCHNPNDN